MVKKQVCEALVCVVEVNQVFVISICLFLLIPLAFAPVISAFQRTITTLLAETTSLEGATHTSTGRDPSNSQRANSPFLLFDVDRLHNLKMNTIFTAHGCSKERLL